MGISNFVIKIEPEVDNMSISPHAQ